MGVIMDVISLISLGYDYLKDIEPAIDKSYQNALKRWTNNVPLRESFAKRQFSNFKQLKEYILSPDSIKSLEIKSLLKYWEEELRIDTRTCTIITEILSRKTLDVVQDIKEKQKQESEQIHSEHSTIVEMLKEVLIKQTNTPQRIIEYKKPSPYIARKVRTYSYPDYFDIHFNPQKYEAEPLTEYIIKGEKKILLYSEAQLGKSTELRNLAFELQQSGLYFPVLFELKKYLAQEPLVKQINEGVFSEDGKIGVLLLDGLDEVRDDKRDNLIREMECIAEQYPHTFIVISCRGNYEKTNDILGFKKLYLNSLNFNDVEEYVAQQCDNPHPLLDAIHRKKLYELVYNPFYLQSIIDYYKTHKTIPETKSEIYDYIIEKSFDVDEGRRQNRADIISLKDQGIHLLEEIAFCLLMTEKQTFTTNELLREIKLSEDELKLCCQFTIFKRDADDSLSFTHNAFKEYLAAKLLSRLQFEKLKPIICYNNSDKLKPNLYNVILLLVGLLDTKSDLYNPLIDWLSSYEKEVFIMCDKHFLSDGKCYEIFRAIYDSYKSQNLYMYYEHAKELMLFANYSESILFLIDEITNEDLNTSTAVNVLLLLEYANFHVLTNENIIRVENILFGYLDKHKEEKDKGDYICKPFANTFFRQEKYVDRFFSIIKDSTNSEVINPFFELLVKNNLCDKYADWAFSKERFIHDFETKGRAMRSVSMDYFYNVLLGFRDNHNIVKALQLYTNKEVYHRKTESDKILELKIQLLTNINFTDISSKSEIINNAVSILMAESTLSYNWNSNNLDIVNIYRAFFNKHGVDKEIFTTCYNEIKKLYLSSQQNNNPIDIETLEKYFNVISTLLDDQRLDMLITDPDFSDEQKYYLTSWLERYEFVYSNTKWTELLASKFSQYRNVNRDFRKEAQDGFNILFNFNEFKQQVIAVFEKYPALSGEWNNRRILHKDSINESVIDYIWDYQEVIDDEKKLPMDDILESLNDERHFNEYAFQNLNRYIDNKSIEVSDTQKQTITNWITCILTNINEHDEIDVNSIIRPMVAFDIKVADNLLLNLVPYSYIQARNLNVVELWGKSPLYPSLLTYIDENIKDKKLLIHKIEEILSSENLYCPELYYCLLEYIVENKIESCYRYVPDILKKGDVADYRSHFKIEVIYRILKLEDVGKRILDTQKTSFDVETLLFYYKEILNKESLLRDDESTQLRSELEAIYPTLEQEFKKDAIKLLLKTGSIDGLCWCIEGLKNGSIIFTDNFPSLDWYNSDQMSKVITIFEIGLSLPYSDYPHDIKESALGAFQRFAMESEEQRDTIISYLKEIAERFPEYSYLNRRANSIHDKFYEYNSHAVSIKEAMSVYKQITE